MIRRSSHVCGLLAGLTLLACSRDPSAPGPASSAASAASATAAPSSSERRKPRTPPSTEPLDRPRTQQELPSTAEAIFLGNLEGRISAARKAMTATPKRPGRYALLVEPLASRGRIRGDLGDLAEAVRIATDGLALEPTSRSLRLLRAEANSSLHRFAEARADARAAHAQHPDDASRAMLADLAWNAGEYDDATREIRELAQKTPSFGHLVRLAQLELDLGNVPAAKAAFARAETRIRDVSPVPIAWLNVQRGLLGLHTGDFEAARVFYAEAVARLPSYPMAVEHLAEIEALLGDRAGAIARYRHVLQLTDDPELVGALAELLRETDQAAEAGALVERARKAYHERLKAFPEAMYWHAAGFFAGEGADPKKALALLRKNAVLRPTATSLAALADAERAVGNLDDASRTIDKALATPVARAEIFWIGARIRLAQREPEKAAALEARAKLLNPRIEALEGPLVEKPL